MKSMAIAALMTAPSLGQAQARETKPAHWRYKGAQLQSEFATCKLGREQSPIDIRGALKPATLPAPAFDYRV